MADEPIRPFEANTPTRAVALVLAIGVVSSMPSAAQRPAQEGPQTPAPAGAALIIGRVIDGTTGTPVVGVTVTIGGASAPRTGNTVLVDSQGRFIFSGLSGGVFTRARTPLPHNRPFRFSSTLSSPCLTGSFVKSTLRSDRPVNTTATRSVAGIDVRTSVSTLLVASRCLGSRWRSSMTTTKARLWGGL
jgi:hypothetical protein